MPSRRRLHVAKVESMIRNDSDYSAQSTSAAHTWLKELALVLNGKTSVYEYADIIRGCVEEIDKTNSTHINADGVGRTELSGRIVKIGKQKLYSCLKEPQKDNYELISLLSEKTNPKEAKKHARRNYSFATKFCHYAAFYVFWGQPEQDNFSIYDSIVSKNLHKYTNHYQIDQPKDISTNYKSFINTVDKIISKSGGKISRNGFDHLLWYYHKAR